MGRRFALASVADTHDASTSDAARAPGSKKPDASTQARLVDLLGRAWWICSGASGGSARAAWLAGARARRLLVEGRYFSTGTRTELPHSVQEPS